VSKVYSKLIKGNFENLRPSLKFSYITDNGVIVLKDSCNDTLAWYLYHPEKRKFEKLKNEEISLEKLRLYIPYWIDALAFESGTSLFLWIIGAILNFNYQNAYWFFASALAGAWLGYRFATIYEIMQRLARYSIGEAKNFLKTQIYNAGGHKLRTMLAIFFWIIDILGLVIILIL
jgi:hypothetical protein